MVVANFFGQFGPVGRQFHCGRLLDRGEYIFFQKKSPDFVALHMFDRLLQSTYMDLRMVSLAQIGPQASKKLPQGQT